MDFIEWVKFETGYEWSELKGQGVTSSQFHLLVSDYEEYCSENNLTPAYRFINCQIK
ncbi:hypothetical protein [Bacillus cereus]|uniref:Uncharacterized protein n=1 Tax=Bacillus cereus 03BB108 TaxID=451709 RepID=A0AAN0SRN9_BACCE|nr:hypothetical protein [Bacillus cereus]AJI08782.1 hypothetical protein AK40_5686 [Bacillus cereus 03BB108]EDX59982.1 hypothetical protein BC03BB108_B0329 [Bacillus cereus 03BB108]QKG99163.1 hypothetical protein FOC96_02595 [Bacillus cereus]